MAHRPSEHCWPAAIRDRGQLRPAAFRTAARPTFESKTAETVTISFTAKTLMSASLPSKQSDRRAYVLMTAAHNEECLIEETIASVLAQSLRPQRWVIVSDNSSDRTDEIVERYAREYDFIRFLQIQRPSGRSFGSKVIALQKGASLLADVRFDFIGNVDADISL